MTNSGFTFRRVREELIETLLRNFKPEVIMNLAAETHVDRSINNPVKFIGL